MTNNQTDQHSIPEKPSAIQKSQRKVHVLFVAHGSRSANWVRVQKQWWLGVNRKLRKRFGNQITSELSFLEITPVLFEDRLKTWKQKSPDRELLVFPFFLSQSGHAGEEIPGIIEEHFPAASFLKVSPRDWPTALAGNIEQRLADYGASNDTPVIISGYGASKHNGNWRTLLKEIQAASKVYHDKEKWNWAPSGHFLTDSEAPLRCQLRSVMARGHRECAIIPLYLSISSYQEKLIPGVRKNYPQLKILTGKDAILPDEKIEQWTVDRIAEKLIP